LSEADLTKKAFIYVLICLERTRVLKAKKEKREHFRTTQKPNRKCKVSNVKKSKSRHFDDTSINIEEWAKFSVTNERRSKIEPSRFEKKKISNHMAVVKRGGKHSKTNLTFK